MRAVALFVFVVASAAIELTGIAIENKDVNMMNIPDRAYNQHEFPVELDNLPAALRDCSARAIALNSTFFALEKPGRTQAEFAQLPIEARNHMSPPRYLCRTFDPTFTQRTLLNQLAPSFFPNTVEIEDGRRTFACADPISTCADLKSFYELPANANIHSMHPEVGERTHWLARKYTMTVEECHGLVLDHNLKNSHDPIITYAYYVEPTHDPENTKKICMGVTGPQRRRNRSFVRREFTRNVWYLGILATPNLRMEQRGGSTNAAMTAGPFEQINNLGCYQPDSHSAWLKQCSTFTYEAALPFNPQPKTIPSSQWDVPGKRQSVEYSAVGARYTFFYNKIAQTTNMIMPVNSAEYQLRSAVLTTIKLEAFTASEAVNECAKKTLYHLSRTFNVVFRKYGGWTCSYAVEEFKNATILSVMDETVEQSYLYSAKMISMQYPDVKEFQQ